MRREKSTAETPMSSSKPVTFLLRHTDYTSQTPLQVSVTMLWPMDVSRGYMHYFGP